MTAHDASFAIDHTLLDAAMPSPAWTNLGCWQRPDGTALRHYRDAAEQLALRVGAAAITAPDQCVADLGCGHGASLLLWQHQFAASRVIGLERQASCVDGWPAQGRDGLSLHQGRFDQLPLPQTVSALLPAAGCDAVVCVDAAYHADSLAAFAAVAQQLLRPQGRLAFTTVLRPTRTGLGAQFRQRLMTRLSGIPSGSFDTAEGLKRTLTQTGFHEVRLAYLDTEVLQGFADFVTRRAQELPRAQRRSLAWLKIAATAAMCRYGFARQALRYVLVSAQT